MKSLLIAASICALAVAGPTRFVSPGLTGPAPIVDWESPISVGPAIIDSPISVGPAIFDPAILDESQVSVGEEVATKTPLVQVIINVNTGSVAGNPVVVEQPEIDPTPVHVVEQPEIEPTPVIVVEQPEIEPTPVIVVEQPEIEPTPVIVVEQPEIEPTPVQVVEQPEIEPTPVIVAP